MILLAKKIIQYNGRNMNYEIFLTDGMLLFKPALYEVDDSYPFAIFTKKGSDWMLRTELKEDLEERFVDKIKTLRVRA